MDSELVDLLRRAQEGDTSAMGEVALTFRETAMSTARALLADRHEVEDAAQDAFLLAFTRLASLRELEAFPGWLQMLVRTAVHRRTRRRRPDLLDEAALEAAADTEASDPDARLVTAEVREAVRDAIRGLEPRLQGVLERFYLDGRPVAEIAVHLGIPAGTVKRRLHEARERLRPGLLGHGPRRDDDDEQPRRRALRLPLR